MNIVENKQLFIDQAKALLSGETNLVTNLANLSALYKEYLPNTNWVGFYLLDEINNNILRRYTKTVYLLFLLVYNTFES